MARYCKYCGKQIDDGICDCILSRKALLEQAVKELKSGDKNAFQTIYKETNNVALAYIKRYCDIPGDWEDILQDVYIKVYRSIGQLEDASKLQAWINKIAANEAIRHNMKKRPKLFSELENDDGTLPEFEDDNENNHPELIADRKAIAMVVDQMLELLPEDQKDALLMIYGQKISIKEMANNLGISENTIKSRLYQGKQKLMARKAEFRKLGVELPAVGVAALIAVTFEENISASAAVGTAGIITAANAAANIINKATVAAVSTAKDASAGAVASSAAGSSSIAGGAAAAGMSISTKAVIGIVAASVIAGGTVAGKYFIDNKSNSNTDNAVTEIAAEETTDRELETTENIVDTEGIYEMDMAALFGKTADEISAYFGEPQEIYGGEGLYIEERVYDNEYNKFTAVLYDNGDTDGLKRCNYVHFNSARDAFGLNKATDIHNLIAAIGGKVDNFRYWTQEDAEMDGDDIDRGMPGQTEVDILSQHQVLYKLFLDDPNIVDPDNENTYVFAYAYTGDYSNNKDAEFEQYLKKYNNNVVNSSDADKYFDLLNSLTDSDYSFMDKDKLKWKYADLDGDGIQELLFACSNVHAAKVGICTIKDGQAIYLGEYGSNGILMYFPGTGYIDDSFFGTGGGLDKLVKLVNGQIEEVVYISRDGQNMEDGDSKIDGQQASPESARSYLNQIYASAGKKDYFNYDSSVSIYDINGKPLKDESIYRYLYQLNENAGSDLEKNQEAANNYTDANLSGEYIFPDSSNRLLTVQELSGMSDYELRLARNEIFARHGYIFSTPEMATYFESKSWYHGSVSPNNFNIDRDLSQVERDNINLIKSMES